jgi:hypothetical protein
MQLGDPSGVEEMLRSLEVARAAGRPDDVMMVYLSLVPLLWRDGRYGEVARHAEEWADYARDRDFPTHDQTREAYRYSLLAVRGEWDVAEAGLTSGHSNWPGRTSWSRRSRR